MKQEAKVFFILGLSWLTQMHEHQKTVEFWVTTDVRHIGVRMQGQPAIMDSRAKIVAISNPRFHTSWGWTVSQTSIASIPPLLCGPTTSSNQVDASHKQHKTFQISPQQTRKRQVATTEQQHWSYVYISSNDKSRRFDELEIKKKCYS